MSKLLIHFLTIHYILTDAVYILDNGIDVRIVADDNEFCNIGRIEFYDGTNWGSFSDCSTQMTRVIADSICQTLGWNNAYSFQHGPYQTSNPDRTIPEYITYTNIYCPSSEYENEDICDYDSDNHDDLFDCDICVNCQISNDFNNQCLNISKNEIHSKYDIYVYCNNQNTEKHPTSYLYNCTDYIYKSNTTKEIYNNDEWHLDIFSSCFDAFKGDNKEKHSNVWKFFVVGGIFIGAVLCMLVYCKSTKRMPHKKFTDAYTLNMENDNDIMLETADKNTDNDIGSNYTSLSKDRKLIESKEKLIDD